MISIENILSHCNEEQLQSILDSSLTIMKHMEFVAGTNGVQLATENEQYWKLYGINALTFSELAQRARGKQRIVEPINK